MTAFVSDDLKEESPVEQLDALFTEKVLLSRKDNRVAMPHGFSIFLGCACSMLTFVSEQLALAAQRHFGLSASTIEYPPHAPRLLLALKRNNVLERDGELKIKSKYLDPVRNFVKALSSSEPTNDDLLLFVSLFQTLPIEAFPEAFAKTFHTGRDVLASLEKILTPMCTVSSSDIAPLSSRDNEDLLLLLSNSVRENPAKVVSKLLKNDESDLNLVQHLLTTKKENTFVDLIVPLITDKAVSAWNECKKRSFGDFLLGLMLALRGIDLPKATALLGKSLNCSARHVLGFLALGRGDTQGVVELVSDVSAEATVSQAESRRSLFALALPMQGLYQEPQTISEEVVPEQQLSECTLRDVFEIADDNGSSHELNFDEYCYLLKILGFDLSEARMLKSFAADDSEGKKLCTLEDAQRGIDRRVDYLMTTRILRVFAKKLDERSLLKNALFFSLVVVLIVLFLFVFSGIEALASTNLGPL